MDGFFGYGNLDSDLWFIGLEEGGGGTEAEVAARLIAWHCRGQQMIEDVQEFHHAAGRYQPHNDPGWLGAVFGPHPPTQRTWDGLIRIIFCARGQDPADGPARHQYQLEHFGRRNGRTAALELRPLPSPGINAWNYNMEGVAPWTEVPCLEGRAAYRNAITEWRIAKLNLLIRKHHPSVVVLYGLTSHGAWESLAGIPFLPEHHAILRPGHPDKGLANTLFSLVPHPGQQYGAAPWPMFHNLGGLINELALNLVDPG